MPYATGERAKRGCTTPQRVQGTGIAQNCWLVVTVLVLGAHCFFPQQFIPFEN
jgi:hypothetical protein